jgi:hypothetical protein
LTYLLLPLLGYGLACAAVVIAVVLVVGLASPWLR